MGITLEEKNRYEINIGPSDIEAGALLVTIFASSPRAFLDAKDRLKAEYRVVRLKLPTKTARGIYCSYGKARQ